MAQVAAFAASVLVATAIVTAIAPPPPAMAQQHPIFGDEPPVVVSPNAVEGFDPSRDMHTPAKWAYVKDSPGGAVPAFNYRIAKWNHDNTRVVIDGECISACTLYVNLKNVCFTPEAQLYFHAASIKHPLNGKRYWKLGEDPYAIYYGNEKIAKFVARSGGLTHQWIILWKEWKVQAGLNICTVDEIETAKNYPRIVQEVPSS